MSISLCSVCNLATFRRHLLTDLGFESKSPEAWQTCAELAQDDIELRFEAAMQWDVDALSEDFATWLSDDSGQPAATSRVGILSSTQCQSLLLEYSNDDVHTYLPLLVRSSSYLYDHQDSPDPHYTYAQLSSARSVLGIAVMKYLEADLRPISLSKKSKKQLETVFLIILGTIMAVTYTSVANHKKARLELLRVLTHYLILVGERVGLLQCDTKKLHLIEGCDNLWNKFGAFEWNHITESDPNDAALRVPVGSRIAAIQNCCHAYTSWHGHENPFISDDFDMSDPIWNSVDNEDFLLQALANTDVAPTVRNNFVPVYDWPDDKGADRSNSLRGGEPTRCLLCDRCHAPDDLCSRWFAQPLVPNGMTSQNGFDPVSWIPNAPVASTAHGSSVGTNPVLATSSKMEYSNVVGNYDAPGSEDDARRFQGFEIPTEKINKRGKRIASDKLKCTEDKSQSIPRKRRSRTLKTNRKIACQSCRQRHLRCGCEKILLENLKEQRGRLSSPDIVDPILFSAECDDLDREHSPRKYTLCESPQLV